MTIMREVSFLSKLFHEGEKTVVFFFLPLANLVGVLLKVFGFTLPILKQFLGQTCFNFRRILKV